MSTAASRSSIRPNRYASANRPSGHGELATAATSGLLLAALWLLTHRYRGLGGDAELYAVQALARLHPDLASDLFLRNTNQDNFTIFSSLYAWCIERLGLQNAALTLTLVCKCAFFSVSWLLARQLASSPFIAFLAVASLIVIPGYYGAFDVFRFAEDWGTARSLGEPLVILSLAVHFRGFPRIAILLALLAILIHPLMALPGLLLLLCLARAPRAGLLVCALAVLAALGIEASARVLPSVPAALAWMDHTWLEVVKERSQFLFLQLWTFDDWAKCSRAAMSLALNVLILKDPAARKLCLSALGLAATGILIALIGSFFPVTLLLQGQAWRWEWLSVYLAVLLLPLACVTLGREKRGGLLCATLMLGAWLMPAAQGAGCLAVALAVWVSRPWIGEHWQSMLNWAVPVVVVAIGAWILRSAWPSVSSALEPAVRSSPLARLRAIFGVQLIALASAWALLHLITRLRLMLLGAVSVSLIALSAWALPPVLEGRHHEGTPGERAEFADWRAAIAPDRSVLVIPQPVAPAFAWFTLERPSYLTVDQSSGVVFSRRTALEVLRRSQVLLPIMDPDWRVLSNLRKGHRHGAADTRPLTRDRLLSICRDPQLGFVIAREDLGLGAIRHTDRGPWKDYLLYDCDPIRDPPLAR